AKGELIAVAVQVALADVMERAVDPALENAKEPFNRIRVDGPAHVFVRRVVHGVVRGEAHRQRVVTPVTVRHHVRREFHALTNGRLQPVVRHHRHREGADAALTFNQCENRHFLLLRDASRGAFVRMPFLAADVGFVHFHGPVEHAEHGVLRHRRTEPMRHEPRGLILHAEHAVQLVGRHAFLRRGHQVNGQQPLGHRHLGVLENRAHGDRELLPTLAALPEAPTSDLVLAGGFRGQAVGIGPAALWAARAVGPAHLFEQFPRRIFVGKVHSEVGQIDRSLIHTKQYPVGVCQDRSGCGTGINTLPLNFRFFFGNVAPCSL
ncbi:MAG: hypothetical protein UY35_C0035G0013, partial [Candidatus Saccharibacteria bacterium GW2011_GWC2_48_9]